MIQNTDYYLVVYLGAQGISSVDVALSYKKPSETSFTSYDLDDSNFQEAELGYYNIKVDKAVLDLLGTYLFRVEAYEIDEVIEKESLPLPLSSNPAPDVCIVTGNIRNISGNAETFSNIAIVVSPRRLPIIADSNLVMGKKITARADYDGFFSIPVIKGATVIFEIEEVGLRFQVVIPEQSTARIEDLIP